MASTVEEYISHQTAPSMYLLHPEVIVHPYGEKLVAAALYGASREAEMTSERAMSAITVKR